MSIKTYTLEMLSIYLVEALHVANLSSEQAYQVVGQIQPYVAKDVVNEIVAAAKMIVNCCYYLDYPDPELSEQKHLLDSRMVDISCHQDQNRRRRRNHHRRPTSRHRHLRTIRRPRSRKRRPGI